MSRLITAITGARNLPLPNGWNLNDGDTLVVSDAVWALILSDDRLASNVVDLGTTVNPLDTAPSWRDIQRTAAGVPVVVIPSGTTLPPSTTPRGAVVLRRVS